jgi:hypothetical protein
MELGKKFGSGIVNGAHWNRCHVFLFQKGHVIGKTNQFPVLKIRIRAMRKCLFQEEAMISNGRWGLYNNVLFDANTSKVQ